METSKLSRISDSSTLTIDPVSTEFRIATTITPRKSRIEIDDSLAGGVVVVVDCTAAPVAIRSGDVGREVMRLVSLLYLRMADVGNHIGPIRLKPSGSSQRY